MALRNFCYVVDKVLEPEAPVAGPVQDCVHSVNGCGEPDGGDVTFGRRFYEYRFSRGRITGVIFTAVRRLRGRSRAPIEPVLPWPWPFRVFSCL